MKSLLALIFLHKATYENDVFLPRTEHVMNYSPKQHRFGEREVWSGKYWNGQTFLQKGYTAGKQKHSFLENIPQLCIVKIIRLW